MFSKLVNDSFKFLNLISNQIQNILIGRQLMAQRKVNIFWQVQNVVKTFLAVIQLVAIEATLFIWKKKFIPLFESD
jgi:hypothetical protein